MSEIVNVAFTGGAVQSVLIAGEPHVVLRPAIESMGLDYSAQVQKLRRRSWAVVGQCPTTGADGKTYTMVTVDLETWAMLLANVDENRVAKTARPVVIAYQKRSARALRDYWLRGAAAMHPTPVPSMFEPHTLTWEEVAALVRQRYGIAMTVNELTRMLRTAGVLKQNGAPRKDWARLFWFTGSAWHVHPHVLPELAQKLYTTGRELQDFRFIQARLEMEGVGVDRIQTAVGGDPA